MNFEVPKKCVKHHQDPILPVNGATEDFRSPMKGRVFVGLANILRKIMIDHNHDDVWRCLLYHVRYFLGFSSLRLLCLSCVYDYRLLLDMLKRCKITVGLISLTI